MLVVVRIDAETGDKAVHHKLYVSILAARPPPEGFGWVEQQSLVGQGGPQVTSGRLKVYFLVKYTPDLSQYTQREITGGYLHIQRKN